MSVNKFAAAIGAAFVILLSATCLRPAGADIKDFEFKLVGSESPAGGSIVLVVQLVRKADGSPVPDAVIFARRLDMAPDDMAAMTVPVEQIPSSEPGTYRFKAKLTMDGKWRLSLGAKVQGETGTVRSEIVFRGQQ